MPKCPICEHEYNTELQPAETFACLVCGTELEVTKDCELVELQIEGEDWGE